MIIGLCLLSAAAATSVDVSVGSIEPANTTAVPKTMYSSTTWSPQTRTEAATTWSSETRTEAATTWSPEVPSDEEEGESEIDEEKDDFEDDATTVSI